MATCLFTVSDALLLCRQEPGDSSYQSCTSRRASVSFEVCWVATRLCCHTLHDVARVLSMLEEARVALLKLNSYAPLLLAKHGSTNDY